MPRDQTAPAWLSRGELAEAVGVSQEVVGAWQRLGLLGGDGDRLPLTDLERARLVVYAQRRGIDAEGVAAACRTQGDVLGQFADQVTGDRGPRRGRSLSTAADVTGLDADTLRRVWVAAGLGDQDEAYDEDLDLLRTVSHVLAVGLPEEALIQLIRVYADALGRVAEAENRLFHYYVHERLRAAGLEGEELTAATNAVGDPIIGLVEPTVLYFHGKAFQRALRDDFVLHLTEATTPPGQATGEMTATIVFVDLAGFTPLTESMGDDAAAQVVERFSELVREAVSRHDGRVVKQIGDEFMLAFADPAAGVVCGLDISDAIAAEAQFPGVRIGAHYGLLLYREADYIGATVNIAARVAGTAARHELLITDALRREVRLPSDVEVTARGWWPLKGLSGEVELFHVRRGLRAQRVIDPVCHMILDADSVATRVRWRGNDVPFCSETCAQRFMADPERYRQATGHYQQ